MASVAETYCCSGHFIAWMQTSVAGTSARSSIDVLGDSLIPEVTCQRALIVQFNGEHTDSQVTAVREVFYNLHRPSSNLVSINGSGLRSRYRPNDRALGRPDRISVVLAQMKSASRRFKVSIVVECYIRLLEDGLDNISGVLVHCPSLHCYDCLLEKRMREKIHTVSTGIQP